MTDITSAELPASAGTRRWRWLPAVGSWRYHALLLATALLVLGPLCGLTSAYMTFSLGFFVGGQVLAGILGSLVTLGYGAEGRHGANLIQTAAGSISGMAGLSALIQALVWLGIPHPPMLSLMLYILAIGMFGAGVGMLYTPLLVDRLKLTFPSGLAVANILRTLTDPVLLKQALGRLAAGIGLGFGGAVAGNTIAVLDAYDVSMSTFGAGMVVGSRIAIPALGAGLLFTALMPVFISLGWLEQGDPYRKISFLIAVGGLMGASAVDISGLLVEAWRRWRWPNEVPAASAPAGDWKKTDQRRVWIWTLSWGVAIVVIGSALLNEPVGYLLFAIAMVFVFALINGIATGISDFSPISATVVVTLLLMVMMGLRDPMIGMIASIVMFIGILIAAEMQQDRSTGWRLGTSRNLQFRYQVAGIVLGAVATIAFAQLFMAAYPVLKLDQTTMSAAAQPKQWTSAGTYKIVGVLRSLSHIGAKQQLAIAVGVVVGVVLQALRRLLPSLGDYQRFVRSGRVGATTEWVMDAVLLPSPYAFFFGGFVNLTVTAWFAAGGVLSSFMNWRAGKQVKAAGRALPSDMSTVSLLGGGMIAGESLAALTVAVVQLMTMI